MSGSKVPNFSSPNLANSPVFILLFTFSLAASTSSKCSMDSNTKSWSLGSNLNQSSFCAKPGSNSINVAIRVCSSSIHFNNLGFLADTSVSSGTLAPAPLTLLFLPSIPFPSSHPTTDENGHNSLFFLVCIVLASWVFCLCGSGTSLTFPVWCLGGLSCSCWSSPTSSLLLLSPVLSFCSSFFLFFFFFFCLLCPSLLFNRLFTSIYASNRAPSVRNPIFLQPLATIRKSPSPDISKACKSGKCNFFSIISTVSIHAVFSISSLLNLLAFRRRSHFLTWALQYKFGTAIPRSPCDKYTMFPLQIFLECTKLVMTFWIDSRSVLLSLDTFIML